MSEDPRISEIRAVLDEWWTNVEATSADGMKAIQRILDRSAPASGEGKRASSVEADPENGVWYVTVLDEPVHHTTEGVPVNVDWTRDGTLIGVELLGPGNLKPAPRVFFPGDTVPAGKWVSYCTPTGIAAAVSNEDWMTMDGAAVELTLPSVDEWVAAVDGARAAARRCRCGVRRGTEHVRNCTERCQDCGSDPDGPRRCHCRARAEREGGDRG